MYIFLITRVALMKTETLRILVSTVIGLVHLHTEIFGTQVKSIYLSMMVLRTVALHCLMMMMRMTMVLITLVIMMTMTMKMMTKVPSQDFALPFHDMVLPDPGFEDMHKVQGCQNIVAFRLLKKKTV